MRKKVFNNKNIKLCTIYYTKSIIGKRFLPCLRDFQVMTYQYEINYQEQFLPCLRDFQVITYQNIPYHDCSCGITCIIIIL